MNDPLGALRRVLSLPGHMLLVLQTRLLVIYGAGAIGGAVARAFADEGARVLLGWRSQASLQRVPAQALN